MRIHLLVLPKIAGKACAWPKQSILNGCFHLSNKLTPISWILLFKFQYDIFNRYKKCSFLSVFVGVLSKSKDFNQAHRTKPVILCSLGFIQSSFPVTVFLPGSIYKMPNVPTAPEFVLEGRRPKRSISYFYWAQGLFGNSTQLELAVFEYFLDFALSFFWFSLSFEFFHQKLLEFF